MRLCQMPDIDAYAGLARTPFKEAIDFLMAKAPMPSAAYTDLLHTMHDRAFVIAGVTKAELLSDVQESLAEAMEGGIPFEQWQRGFNKAIEGRWLPTDRTGAPNSGWRAKVIYDTNIQAAYAAGRYEQLQRLRRTHPYWRYRHSGTSRVPRPEHLAWDGLVLKADDPWWDTHYPPNGWGCNCLVEPVDEIDIREMGKDGPDKAPPSPMKKVRLGEREIHAPADVAPEWAYAPGAGGNQGLLRALAQGHPPLAAEAWESIKEAALKHEVLAFQSMAAKILKVIKDNPTGSPPPSAMRGLMHGNARVVGFLDRETLEKARALGMPLASAGIEVIDVDIFHAMRAFHQTGGVAIADADYLNLPRVLAKPKAVLYDKTDPALIYVFDVGNKSEYGIFVIKEGVHKAATRSKKKTRQLNKVRTARLAPKDSLANKGVYEHISGSL